MFQIKNEIVSININKASLIFFVYPFPKACLPAGRGAKNRAKLARRARRSQNQFTPLGDGVNKLIFKRFIIKYT
jgi:hypothetical protein